MVREVTKGNRTGHNVEIRSKCDTGPGEKVITISIFRRLCPGMFGSTGEVLEKFYSDWTTPTVIEEPPSSSLE